MISCFLFVFLVKLWLTATELSGFFFPRIRKDGKSTSHNFCFESFESLLFAYFSPQPNGALVLDFFQFSSENFEGSY